MLNKLYNKDLEEIVNIHMDTLSDDLLPQLGRKYLLSFYQYLSKSEKEIIFLIEDNDKIIGFCMISLEPKTLLSRVIRYTFIRFIGALFINLLKKRLLRKYLFNIIFKKNTSIFKSPEIVYMFINRNFQNNGIGKKLIEKVRIYLLKKEYQYLYVKTIDSIDNKAICFYQRNNFSNYSAFQYAGNKYLYFKKNLNV